MGNHDGALPFHFSALKAAALISAHTSVRGRSGEAT